jgi:LysR family glycine cleavage system transcriptional activator
MNIENRLPSLSGLIAFEATARHLSYKKASTELFLTQTAISHSITNLEDILGTKLFLRLDNSIKLTKSGEDYLVVVRDVLVTLSSGTKNIRAQNDEKSLTIECLGIFAISQLLPKLHEFREKYPHINIRLRTIQSLQNKINHSFDVAIWHGSGKWIGLDATKLGEEEIFPVCSPKLLQSKFPLTSPQDLEHHTIIKTSSPLVNDDWSLWLDHAKLSNVKFKSIIDCDYFMTSLQAAVNGLGVTLGRSSIVKADLEKGNLIEPFSIRVKSSNSYYIVSPTETTHQDKVVLFKTWFLEAFLH